MIFLDNLYKEQQVGRLCDNPDRRPDLCDTSFNRQDIPCKNLASVELWNVEPVIHLATSSGRGGVHLLTCRNPFLSVLFLPNKSFKDTVGLWL